MQPLKGFFLGKCFKNQIILMVPPFIIIIFLKIIGSASIMIQFLKIIFQVHEQDANNSDGVINAQGDSSNCKIDITSDAKTSSEKEDVRVRDLIIENHLSVSSKTEESQGAGTGSIDNRFSEDDMEVEEVDSVS